MRSPSACMAASGAPAFLGLGRITSSDACVYLLSLSSHSPADPPKSPQALADFKQTIHDPNAIRQSLLLCTRITEGPFSNGRPLHLKHLLSAHCLFSAVTSCPSCRPLLACYELCTRAAALAHTDNSQWDGPYSSCKTLVAFGGGYMQSCIAELPGGTP